jgi:tetratricopeptide (TPR) repeat protein
MAQQLKPSSYTPDGSFNRRLGEYQNAADDYTKAIELDPDNVLHYAYRAWAYYHLGEYTNQKTDEATACSLDSKYC